MKEIIPLQRVNARIAVPGSKSITQRALIAAALADGTSTLIGPLASEDTRYTSTALEQMGIRVDNSGEIWTVSGSNGAVQTPKKPIFLGNNGTATRFLTSVAALGSGLFQITGEKRMEERPISPLMSALKGWGVEIESIKGTGCPPLEIRAKGLAGGKTVLPEGKSSQYLSSLLLVAPYAAEPASLDVLGEVYSKPYVTMTLAVMKSFGAAVEAAADLSHFRIQPQHYKGREYHIEGDASSASYFFAAAAITGGTMTIDNFSTPSLQGDAALLEILESMGCTLDKSARGVTLTGPEQLRGVEVDMADCPDVAPTLAIVASRAHGRTVIKNIAHLRIKECDRLHVMAKELARIGARVQELPDTLIIEGLEDSAPPMHGAEIETYNDHRIAMCFAVAGLVVPGIKILGEECVAKSFPDFWQRFEKIYH
jgi:3-phosphoshikimate 1-carboxyvinyltransferase